MAKLLSREDLKDICEIAKGILDSTSVEEVQGAVKAIQEILDQDPVEVHRLVEHDLGGEG